VNIEASLVMSHRWSKAAEEKRDARGLLVPCDAPVWEADGGRLAAA
jgi:hypothetical protein